jgi:hypothetical protein
MKEYRLVSLVGLLTAVVIVGCGGNKDSDNSILEDISEIERIDNNEKGSNIPYLRENHMTYRQYATTDIPQAIKDVNNKNIRWTISASSKEGAIQLVGHIQFMVKKLETGNNPRAWDKLFLMEAYMKKHGHYETFVERSGIDVFIRKEAHTSCSYEVLSAHSNAVGGDFFARADVGQDYSLIAEAILASPACNNEKQALENYIIDRQHTRG